MCQSTAMLETEVLGLPYCKGVLLSSTLHFPFFLSRHRYGVVETVRYEDDDKDVRWL